MSGVPARLDDPSGRARTSSLHRFGSRWSRFSELGMRFDTAARPWSIADNRARRRGLRSRSRQESVARPSRVAFAAVPHILGTLGRQTAISLRSAASRSRFRYLQRTHSRNFQFDRDPLPVRQRPGQRRLHFPAQRLIPRRSAPPGSAMGPGPSTRRPLIAFLPDPTPGVPMPRYFSNTLWLRTGRICTPLLSVSNSSRSPARTPRIRRTSMGTVIWPLLVILACFCMASSDSLLYHIFLTWHNSTGEDHF